jgi:hypothetical protein
MRQRKQRLTKRQEEKEKKGKNILNQEDWANQYENMLHRSINLTSAIKSARIQNISYLYLVLVEPLQRMGCKSCLQRPGFHTTAGGQSATSQLISPTATGDNDNATISEQRQAREWKVYYAARQAISAKTTELAEVTEAG